MNVHVGLPEFLQFAAMAVLFGFFWRSLTIRFADNSVGKAMAFIF